MNIAELKKRHDVPIITADEQGFITYINDCFTDTFDWPKDKLIGELLTTIIPHELHDAHNLGFSLYISTGEPTLLNKPIKLHILTGAGQQLESKHFIIAEKSHNKWQFGAVILPPEEITNETR